MKYVMLHSFEEGSQPQIFGRLISSEELKLILMLQNEVGFIHPTRFIPVPEPQVQDKKRNSYVNT